MTRKIRLLFGTLFIIGLLLILSPNKAHADETVIQVVSDPAPSTDTATATVPLTIQTVDTKINDAQTTLTSASQTQGNAIISTIQSNVPNTDTATAVSIATTQEPIKTAVESATVVIQQANTAIQSAQTALTVAIAAQTNLETQTAIVATNQITLTTETNKLPDLQTTASTTCTTFYTENSNLGTATSNVSIAETAVSNAITDLANSQPITTTTNGITATTYAYSGSTASPLPVPQTVPLSTTTVPSLSNNWGNGQVLNSGRADNVVVKFEGTITLPEEAVIVRYNTYADDGTKLYIDGVLAIDNWRDQGPRYSNYSQDFNVSTDKQQDFTLWYYEHGGGATVNLGWVIIRADGTGYFTFPQAEAFSSVTTTQDPVKVAAVDTAKTNLTSVKTAYDTQLAVRDAAYQAWQDAVHSVNAQQSVIDAAQAAYDTAQANLLTAQQNATIAIQAADSFANTATTKVNEAIAAMTNAATVTTNYYVEQQRIAAEQAAAKAAQEKAAAEERARISEANRIAAEQAIAEAKAAQEKAAAEAKAAEEARIKAEQDAIEAQAAADKAAEDARIQAEIDAKAESDKIAAEEEAAAKAEADRILEEQKAKDEADRIAQEEANAQAEADKQQAEEDRIAQEKADKEQQAIDAKAEQDAKIAEEKAIQAEEDKKIEEQTGLKPNNPDQLSDTVVKEAPKEVLVAHIQVDKAGVENGGIEFFGTKSAPQVVGEDGKLTPPAPPPGSGLPIPADAITTTDTFIGQPGGTTFNAPDIAVPVLMTYVCETITRDGKEIHLDVNGDEHPISQCTFLPAALNAIPGAGQAVQAVGAAYTAMANIGNDMSPITRKKAKKILVLTVAVTAIRRRFGQ